MITLTNAAVRWIVLTFAVVMLIGVLPPRIARIARAQAPKPEQAEYVGLTKCAACHFAQYKIWKTSTHGKALDNLPTKYRQDAECLKCHATGHGHDSAPSVGSLTGISCEACHGPGGEHSKHALRFVDEGITEAGLNRLRTSIQPVAVDQCIKCHVSEAHKTHPPFDREEPAAGKSTEPTATRPISFFNFKAHEEKPGL